MEGGRCDKPGCTVAETGICLLSHPDPTTCPHFRREPGDREEPAETGRTAEHLEALPSPASVGRQFPVGLELGTAEAAEIMRARYAYLVGVLGFSDAGKTCFLLSLYLMASRGALLPTYRFAGSQTLPGFEARARRLRNWRGGALPEQLADHTRLADPRQPAFLHVALHEGSGVRPSFDVLLTDLPGEWSKNLVDRAGTADRFAFLRRADGIIVVVDGPVLESKSRHSELQRSCHLLDRIVQSVGVDTATPLVLLVSKSDRLGLKRPAVIDALEAHARSIGFNPAIVLCAAFSEVPETVPNGLGVLEALQKALVQQSAPRSEASEPRRAASGGRAFLQFRLGSV